MRRRAQLAAIRPDLVFTSLRGNIATRLAKVPPGGAIVVAAAALQRLGLDDQVAEVFPATRLLPQVGQGALAVECRAGDEETRSLLASIDDAEVRLAVETERRFLARLGTGCDLPVGAYATVEGASLVLDGLIASLDGRRVIRQRREVPADGGPAAGTALAEALLAAGGRDLLAGPGPGR